MIENKVAGVLDIQQEPPGRLTGRDMQLMNTVADQLAVALQQASLYADLQSSLRQEQATRSQLIHSERLAAVGRLLASVSHELSNPMQAIQNALFLLKEEKGISSQGRQDLEIILSEAERMAVMLERLRTSYQPVRAEDFQPVQVNDIIETVHALTATFLRHSTIAFEFRPNPDLPTVPGLADQLRQVFLNLFMNAVDAMDKGGRLVVSTHLLTEHREVLIEVADTGPGIDPELLPTLFEAFVTNKEGGSGLGLSISHGIVTKHRGRIQAENDPQGGAIFRVWLPLERAREEE
jgi:signal transduction histidine kinase